MTFVAEDFALLAEVVVPELLDFPAADFVDEGFTVVDLEDADFDAAFFVELPDALTVLVLLTNFAVDFDFETGFALDAAVGLALAEH